MPLWLPLVLAPTLRSPFLRRATTNEIGHFLAAVSDHDPTSSAQVDVSFIHRWQAVLLSTPKMAAMSLAKDNYLQVSDRERKAGCRGRYRRAQNVTESRSACGQAWCRSDGWDVTPDGFPL